MIPMKTALTGSMMLRSIMMIRCRRRAGSGAGISNSRVTRVSHWTRPGVITVGALGRTLPDPCGKLSGPAAFYFPIFNWDSARSAICATGHRRPTPS